MYNTDDFLDKKGLKTFKTVSNGKKVYINAI